MRKGFTGLADVGLVALVAGLLALSQNRTFTTTLYSKNTLTAEDYEFMKFITVHGKSYGTKEEYEFRASLFKKTIAKIKEENAKTENTFTVGINRFADWTNEEIKRLLGYKSSKIFIGNVEALPGNVSIPSSVDWRT